MHLLVLKCQSDKVYYEQNRKWVKSVNQTVGKIGTGITGISVLLFAISMILRLFIDSIGIFLSCLSSLFIHLLDASLWTLTIRFRIIISIPFQKIDSDLFMKNCYLLLYQELLVKSALYMEPSIVRVTVLVSFKYTSNWLLALYDFSDYVYDLRSS